MGVSMGLVLGLLPKKLKLDADACRILDQTEMSGVQTMQACVCVENYLTAQQWAALESKPLVSPMIQMLSLIHIRPCRRRG